MSLSQGRDWPASRLTFEFQTVGVKSELASEAIRQEGTGAEAPGRLTCLDLWHVLPMLDSVDRLARESRFDSIGSHT